MFGLEDEYYQRIERQAKLIEALKAECEAAWAFYDGVGDRGWHPEIIDPYEAARAARLKLEEKE